MTNLYFASSVNSNPALNYHTYLLVAVEMAHLLKTLKFLHALWIAMRREMKTNRENRDNKLDVFAHCLSYFLTLKPCFNLEGFWVDAISMSLVLVSSLLALFGIWNCVCVRVWWKEMSLSSWDFFFLIALVDFCPLILCKTFQTSGGGVSFISKVTGGEEEREQRLLYLQLSSYTLPVRRGGKEEGKQKNQMSACVLFAHPRP